MVDLMSKKWLFFIISGLIILPGMISLALYGLNLGVDFTGGALLEYQFEKPIKKEEIKNLIAKDNIEVPSIVDSGQNTYIIRTKPINEKQIARIRTDLGKEFGKVTEIRLENVGPVIGGETTKNAVIALILSSVMIVIYLAVAFRKVPKPTSSWRFGITAVIALLHDALLLLGVFSILGHYWGVEVDVLFMTALLTAESRGTTGPVKNEKIAQAVAENNSRRLPGRAPAAGDESGGAHRPRR